MGIHGFYWGLLRHLDAVAPSIWHKKSRKCGGSDLILNGFFHLQACRPEDVLYLFFTCPHMQHRHQLEIGPDDRRRGFGEVLEGAVEEHMAFMKHHGARFQSVQQVFVVGDDKCGARPACALGLFVGGED